jgi:hypothetical protein
MKALGYNGPEKGFATAVFLAVTLDGAHRGTALAEGPRSKSANSVP